ncbi:aldehyde dehydrogenase family protein [Rubritalea tangerina]|uniref:aldehyde dehydrogenase (NAD(+)) n=1 Tax=Rubritalea tangerina TaxID=430798 RepID=A0ABW4Z682_9BACT
MSNPSSSSISDLGITATNPSILCSLLPHEHHGPTIPAESPIDASQIAQVHLASPENTSQVLDKLPTAFKQWRQVPAPVRGQLIRRFSEQLRHHQQALAALITLEVGKIHSEALGEVQEMIDICEFALGLSRQLHGLTIATERPNHRLMEQWHPLGPVAIITAFNFPVAVWAWNATLALICGNPIIWKPSHKAPLCAVACHNLLEQCIQNTPQAPPALSSVIIGRNDVGKQLASHPTCPLVSATGSVAMGRDVGTTVASRFGRSLLELGGNNAMIVTEHANLDLALRAILFSAVGTAGQRCTTLRRLILHPSIATSLCNKLTKVYTTLNIGDPRDASTLVGPLIDAPAVASHHAAIQQALAEGGELLTPHSCDSVYPEGGHYVAPTILKMPPRSPIMQQETFSPILYITTYSDLGDAISQQNDVPQGLASSIFTNQLQEAEYFLSPAGSDCGIANVNIGTSGAEIGGAFGGEKETGGGRESGSDAWKNYMRRTTNTINFGADMPLAQGVTFDT